MKMHAYTLSVAAALVGCWVAKTGWAQSSAPMVAARTGDSDLETVFQEAIAKSREVSLPRIERLEAALDAKQLAEELQEDIPRFTACVAVAQCQLGLEDMLQYEAAITEAERLLDGMTGAAQLCWYYQVKGMERQRHGSYMDAIGLLRRCEQYAKQANQGQLQARAELNIGICLRRLGALDKAAESYKLALEIAERFHAPSITHSATNNLAYLMLELDKLDEAEAIYKSIPEGVSASIDLAVQAGFADIAVRRGQNLKARELASKAMEITKTGIPTPYQCGILKLIIARSYLAEENWEAAEEYCVDAIEALKVVTNRQDDASIVLGEIYLNTGRGSKGFELIESVAERSANETIRQKAYQRLAELYLKVDQNKKAFLNLQKSQSLRNKHVTREAEIAIALMQSKLQSTLQHQLEIDRLQFEAAEAEAARALADAMASKSAIEAAASRKMRNISMLGAICLVLGAGAYIVVDRRRRNERRLKELEQENNLHLTQIVEEKSAALIQQVRERAELEKSLERKRRDEAIGQLTGSVAHDFNNLLQVVVSTNELLESAGNLNRKQVDILKISMKSTETGASIVKQLLAYARQQTLTPKTMKVGDYFDGTCNLLRAAIGNNCRLVVDDRSRGACVLLDSTQLTTALINLLSNSVDAMPGGGTICVSSQTVEVGEQTADTWPELEPGTYVTFEVADAGKGMNAEEKLRAFEPFYSTKLAVAGTGLGLSSVYGFVKQSGGDVKIFDEPTGGIRVTMIFPVVSEVIPTEESIEKPVKSRQCKVLVVEDNEAVAKSIVAKLVSLGFEAEWAMCGIDALGILSQKHDFEVVLSDVRMPGELDGVALRAWVKQHQPELSVILMTGYSDTELPHVSTTVLQKPFTETQLLQSISSEMQLMSTEFRPHKPLSDPRPAIG